MNDNDIIEIMKVCSMASGCKSCRFADSTDCAGEASAFALDLINRQKAEIERLKDMIAQNNRIMPKYAQLIKAETLKEFAEKIKGIDLYQCIEEYYKNAELCYDVRQDWFCEYIDRLVKEMTEEHNGNV